MTLKTAVVIGAGQGMGQTTALLLARHGLTVYLVGRTEAKLQTTADAIRAAGGSCHVFPADLTEETALDALTAQLTADQVALDLLVHCAGESFIKPIEYSTFADFNRNIGIN